MTLSRIGQFWRGHLFLFGRPQAAGYSTMQGYKLLAIFAILEFAVRPFLRAEAGPMGIASRPWWMLLEMSFLTALACGMVIGFTGVRLSDLGL